MNITNQRSWLDNPRLRYRRQLRSLLFGESLTINGYQIERSLEGGYSYFIDISTEEQSLEQVLDLLTKEDTMTQFKLPIGALTRPLADTVVRESGVWYGFNIGTEQRKSIKYWLRETIEALNNIHPVTAVAPASELQIIDLGSGWKMGVKPQAMTPELQHRLDVQEAKFDLFVTHNEQHYDDRMDYLRQLEHDIEAVIGADVIARRNASELTVRAA